MTYRERELLVSRSSQQQKHNSQRSTSSNSHNRWIPSRLSSSQSLRIECKAEERHYIGDSSLHTINSSLKPIRFTMNDQLKPVQFRSEIIVHKNPDTDLHIKRLRVAFHYHDDTPVNAIRNHQSSSARNQSLHIPKPSLEQQSSIRKSSPVTSNTLLHQWIDDICSNEKLMANNDIVFFIKNGEFFARI